MSNLDAWTELGLSQWGLVALSYVIGSIPFGLLITRALKGVDLRTVGSGNIGATNAMRVLGKPLGIVVFLLDAGKGGLVILFAVPLFESAAPAWLAVLCGAAAVMGHCWSIFLRFEGGKGVATGAGALAAIDLWIFLGAGLVWIVVLLTSRMVALASIALGLAFPVVAYLRAPEGDAAIVVGASALTILILVRHRSNMARMLAGTEPRAFQKKSTSEAASSPGESSS